MKGSVAEELTGDADTKTHYTESFVTTTTASSLSSGGSSDNDLTTQYSQTAAVHVIRERVTGAKEHVSSSLLEVAVDTPLRENGNILKDPNLEVAVEVLRSNGIIKEVIPQVGVHPPKKEYLNGPDQVVPSDVLTATHPSDRVKLVVEDTGAAALPPLSVPGLLHSTATRFPDHPALATKLADGSYSILSYSEYEASVRTCAKAFLKLGLQKYHSVCIMGFNSVEWFLSDLGAIYAGGFAVGIYTTNSPEACHYVAHSSRANIVVVEDAKQLQKILEVRDRLPDLRAIVQYSGTPTTEGVLSWDQLMQIGTEEPEEPLENAMRRIAVNECCSLVYTSGTVGMPKAVMLSHDNFTWGARVTVVYIGLKVKQECIVSYLPLSHVAAQCTDIYCPIAVGATVYFADKDALKGSLVKTLQEVRPTHFLGVPRVWEKIYEKMMEIGSQTTGLKKMVATWAKSCGLQYNLNKMNGSPSRSLGYIVARAFIFSKVKRTLGLDRCHGLLSGAAPLSPDVKLYFMSLDIPVKDVYGMSETTGAHTVSREDHFRLESTGTTIPGMATRINQPDDKGRGEILMKGRNIFMGYLNDEAKTTEALDGDRWLHSGDVGWIDNEGFLYITGRIKEILITAGGENVAPVLIEDNIKKELPVVSNAMLIGDGLKFLSVLLTLKTETNPDTGEALDALTPTVKAWCEELGCQVDTVTELLSSPDLQKVETALQEGINKANSRAISNAQRVQKFALLPHDFSIPTGELGPTLKLKRNVVTEKYADIITNLYR